MAQQQTVTVPYTQATLTTLDSAIAAGVQTVDYGTYRVTYRSLDDMLALRAIVVSYLVSQGDGQRPVNTRGSVFISR